MKADELRKIACDKQEKEFWKNYNYCISTLDEWIEYVAKECGSTGITLNRIYHTSYLYTFRDRNFIINKETYKELKKYYKERGFKIRKLLNKITISWW